MSDHGNALPEPETPSWLPAVGVALFVVAGLMWAAKTSTKPSEHGVEGKDAAPQAATKSAH